MNVIVLNLDHSFLNVVTVKKALKMVAKSKVKVLKYSDKFIRGYNYVIKIPLIIKLIKLVRTLYKTRVPFSKRAVHIRDGFKCAYCGKTSKKLTIDHVLPRAKGGKTSFENCVAACKPCNNKKSDKTCKESGMYPTVRAYQPVIMEFMRLKEKALGINKVINDLYKEL